MGCLKVTWPQLLLGQRRVRVQLLGHPAGVGQCADLAQPHALLVHVCLIFVEAPAVGLHLLEHGLPIRPPQLPADLAQRRLFVDLAVSLQNLELSPGDTFAQRLEIRL